MRNIATPRFTKRHYTLLAHAIGHAAEYRNGITGAIVAMLKADNPAFNADTFHSAIDKAIMQVTERRGSPS